MAGYTDALNTDGALGFVYPLWAVRLSSDDSPPSLGSEISTELFASQVTQTAGGQSLDTAQLSWKLSEPLINRTQPADFTKMVDVLLPDTALTRVHLGDYIAEDERVNATGESLTAVSQMRPYHFGPPLGGEYWRDAFDSPVVILQDITFNPRIDGIVRPNRSGYKREDNKSFLWVHPGAVMTERARDVEGGEVERWTLSEAIDAICWHCNPDQTTIRNPDDLEHWFEDKNAPELDAVTLPRGKHLPFYLDSLLHPLGFNWFLKYAHVVDKNEFLKHHPEIVVFKKGVGRATRIGHQAPGEHLDLEKSNCNAYSISRNIGNQHNAVRVTGDLERREVTLPLWPGWPEEDDYLSAADLKKSESGSSYNRDGKKTVHRLWLANEAGDITGMRENKLAAGDPPDLCTYFHGEYIPHRRRAEPPLSYATHSADADVTRRDVLVEWREESSPGVYTEWLEVAATIAVLPDQIGIMLTDDSPPDALVTEGRTELRITCTVVGDSPVEGVAEPATNDDDERIAVNGRDVWLELQLPQKFSDRQVAGGGEYGSVLAGTPGDTQNDREEPPDGGAIMEYAEKIRDQGGSAEVDCEFVLPGIHLAYEIGDLVTRIEGREVDLDAASPLDEEAVYPQITGRTFSYDATSGPSTKLILNRGVRLVSESNQRRRVFISRPGGGGGVDVT